MNLNKLKILFVGLADPNHSKAGGYHKIALMPGTDVYWDKDAPFGFLKPHKSGKVINIFFQELLTRWKFRNYDIVHFFYGDNLLFPFKSKKSAKLVATIHMNINQRKKAPERFIRTLKTLDGIITLSSCQQKELKSKYGLNSVFIPHGFDKPTYTFVDMGIDKKKINVVISGSNYRDINTMLEVINYCKKEQLNIQFHLLGQPRGVKGKLINADNAKCYPRLNDDEYYSVIHSCDYNFLPLIFATANNALLEAQFLGVSSILPNMAGIDDYAAPTPYNYFYNTQEELFNIFKSLQKLKSSEKLVFYAEKFLWKNIYPQLKSFYSSLLEQK